SPGTRTPRWPWSGRPTSASPPGAAPPRRWTSASAATATSATGSSPTWPSPLRRTLGREPRAEQGGGLLAPVQDAVRPAVGAPAPGRAAQAPVVGGGAAHDEAVRGVDDHEGVGDGGGLVAGDRDVRRPRGVQIGRAS